MRRYLGREYYEEYENKVNELAEKYNIMQHEVDDVLKDIDCETFEEQIKEFEKIMSE